MTVNSNRKLLKSKRIYYEVIYISYCYRQNVNCWSECNSQVDIQFQVCEEGRYALIYDAEELDRGNTPVCEHLLIV